MSNISKYKRGLMTQYPCARGRSFVCKNIGDYIQAVASCQFVNPVDEIIEQEEADSYKSNDGRKCRLIMNGWFQWRAENWPPSNDVYPLLVSMHISPLRQEQLLSQKGIAFLKRYSPVGCRDRYTEQLLQSRGIPAYFSGCVTLTLGKKYYMERKQRSGIYFVDPYFPIPPLYSENNGDVICKDALYSFFRFYAEHKDIIDELASHPFFRSYSPTGFLDRDTSFYRAYYKAYCFYKVYSQKFDDDILLSAEYITHWMDVDMQNQSNTDLFLIAENLVKKYASADLVVTSRIHAGLPCLGLDIPVIFVANEEVTSDTGTFNTPGRLGGLIELFRVLKLIDGAFSSDDSVLNTFDRIGVSSRFENKNEWKPFANRLSKQLEAFMADSFSEEEAEEIRAFSMEEADVYVSNE